MHVTAIIAAAGSGRRLGAAKPKQLIDIGGGSMLQHSLTAFHEHPRINEIVVVLPKGIGSFRLWERDPAGEEALESGRYPLTEFGIQIGSRRALASWKADPALKVLWFGEIKSPGKLECALSLRLPANTVSKLRLTVGGQLVARPSGGEKEGDDRQRNRDLALHRLSPSFKPERTTQSRSLQSPMRTSFFFFASASIAERGISNAFSTASRRMTTRADRPGRMRAASM